jgi:hypothetical protein
MAFSGGSAGTIAVTPTEPGTYAFALNVTDSISRVATQSFTISIDPVTITTISLPTASQRIAYSQSLSAAGSAPFTWTLGPGWGSLPPGLTLATNGTV